MVCKPLLYCDVNPMIQDALKSMITSKKIPSAKIVNDIRNVDDIMQIVGGRTVHVLTASWPCIGWSLAGQKEEFNNVHSSLFFAWSLSPLEKERWTTTRSIVRSPTMIFSKILVRYDSLKTCVPSSRQKKSAKTI